MTKVRRYAEGTTVPAESSQAEIRLLLTKHGGTHFGLISTPDYDAIEFVLNGYHYRFKVEQPNDEWGRKNKGPRQYIADVAAAEWKRRWRARLIWLKATLEFASGEGGGALPLALAAFAVLPQGGTVGEALVGGTLPLLGSGR